MSFTIRPIESDIFLTSFRSKTHPSWLGRVRMTTNFGEVEINCGPRSPIFENAAEAVRFIADEFTSWADNVWIETIDGDWRYAGNVGELSDRKASE